VHHDLKREAAKKPENKGLFAVLVFDKKKTKKVSK